VRVFRLADGRPAVIGEVEVGRPVTALKLAGGELVVRAGRAVAATTTRYRLGPDGLELVP
jgi:hypothetical protein